MRLHRVLASRERQDETAPHRSGFRRAARFFVAASILLSIVYVAAGFFSSRLRWIPTIPAPAAALPFPPMNGPVVTGVLSIHTEKSHDAVGTLTDVVNAARKAGLDFVVLGDHPPVDTIFGNAVEPSRYLGGVLVVPGIELVALDVGRLLVVGLDSTVFIWRKGLDPLAELVSEHEALTFVVHGRSSRARERWHAETTTGAAGWEVLDVSEAARRRLDGPWALYHLLSLVSTLPLGLGHESLLRLNREGFDVPAVAAFDSLRLGRRLTATAGLNHHPKVEIGSWSIPPYGPAFRTLGNHVILDRELSADPRKAEQELADALRRGSVYISRGDFEAARGFQLAIGGNGRNAPAIGEETPYEGGMVLRAGFGERWRSRLLYRLMRDGEEVAWFRGSDLEWRVPGPGLYRVEVYRYTARISGLLFNLRPWIFTNPVRLSSEPDSTVDAP
jgi:hypothetical protein